VSACWVALLFLGPHQSGSIVWEGVEKLRGKALAPLRFFLQLCLQNLDEMALVVAIGIFAAISAFLRCEAHIPYAAHTVALVPNAVWCHIAIIDNEEQIIVPILGTLELGVARIYAEEVVECVVRRAKAIDSRREKLKWVRRETHRPAPQANLTDDPVRHLSFHENQ